MNNDKNPWVGLRAYTEGEILYGRDRDILELSTYILAETEVVLYGKSGTGKSSIINAGILPAARRNGYVPVTIRLEHNNDSSLYVVQLKNAIKKAGVTIKNIVPYHVAGQPLLWEFFHCNEFLNADGDNVRLLIIFDQFEEIFTLQENNETRTQFFKEVADVLNDIKPRSLCIQGDEISEEVAVQPNSELSNDDVFSQIENLDLDDLDDAPAYAGNTVHFVFTLREDYLSDFEFYTKKIPALKQHRYAFRPINENQAMEIIMNPQKGLVSETVAKQIIAKISKTCEGDSVVNSGIDSAILSLFLSELYQKLPENATAITSDMLDTFGKSIIRDYYVSAVSDSTRIRPKAVEWIEDNLLTKDNKHRDNKHINDVIDSNKALTKEELDYLEKEKRILSRFKRSKITRIEFVHDVIADVAAQHKIMRESEKLARLEQDSLAKKAKKKFWFTIIVASILVIGAISLMWFYMSKPMTGLPHKQSFIISFLEDSLTNENDYWKGDLSIIGHRVDAPDTILFTKVIDKGLRDSVYKLEIDTLRSISFSMKFPSYSKYQDISLEKDYSDIMKMLNVQLKLKKKRPKTYPYFGNVSVETNGIKWPIQNALICLHDITTRTDSCGNFRYYLEKEVAEDDDIFIIKKGFYSNNDFKAGINDPNEIHEFLLLPKDSIQTIKTWVASIDSLSNIREKTTYSIKNQKIYKKDGSTDVLNLVAVYNKTVDNKYYIDGYFYFNSDLKKNINEDKYYSYYILTGEIDRNWSNGYKNYSVEGTNYIGNIIDITGTYKQKVGTWTGELSSPVGFNAYFPKKEN